MILPNVNANGIYNGSNKDDLRKEYHQAYRDMKKAAESFNSVHFHARDYDSREFPQAQDDRIMMAKKMREVIQYLEQHVIELL